MFPEEGSTIHSTAIVRSQPQPLLVQLNTSQWVEEEVADRIRLEVVAREVFRQMFPLPLSRLRLLVSMSLYRH